MVNINRNRLTTEDQEYFLHQFDATLSKLELSGTSVLLNELLGKEERLTLAKRLAAIVLLHEGCSEYKTALVLKLSPTTTGIIASKMKLGAYTNSIKLLQKKKKDYFVFLETLDSILHLGGFLPHKVGLDRYRHL